jgi:hypothetical protein
VQSVKRQKKLVGAVGIEAPFSAMAGSIPRSTRWLIFRLRQFLEEMLAEPKQFASDILSLKGLSWD